MSSRLLKFEKRDGTMPLDAELQDTSKALAAYKNSGFMGYDVFSTGQEAFVKYRIDHTAILSDFEGLAKKELEERGYEFKDSKWSG